MQLDKPNKHIRAAWDRFSGRGAISIISLDEMRRFVEQRGLTVEQIEEVEFGCDPKHKAIFLKTVDGSALYPRQSLEDMEVYQSSITPTENLELFWNKVDWFSPPFLRQEEVYSALDKARLDIKTAQHIGKDILQKRFEPALSSIYTHKNIIPITVQTLTDSVTIGKHLKIIKESILAFYSGMQIIAITALVPIVEDALRLIIGERDSDLDLISKVNRAINLANRNAIKLHINNADWIPPEYVEIPVLKVLNKEILMLETIRYWLINSFYSKTEDYCNHSGFNRHFFAHAKSEIWQKPSNFFRAMGLIQALALIERFAVEESKVKIFTPTPDNRSQSFNLEVTACIEMQIIKNSVLSKNQIANQLPHHPTASDDGWLRRSAILSEKMNSEIISKLRDNGWQCHSFTEPNKQGEYITVNAKKEEHGIKVALLYSSATSNTVYKELDESCDYILYQGPYRQHGHAHGVKAQVLPLSAWITPS